MTLRLLAEVSPQELLVGLADLQSHLLGYVKSMALKCVVDLGIPDAIHRRGGAATLTDIATDTGVHQGRIADLQRLMDLLSTSGMFSVTDGEGSGGGSDAVVLCDWFRSEPAAAGSIFELAHGSSLWEMARKDAALGSVLNDSMVADNQLFLEVIILDKGRIFRGLSSLVDVGGGNGAGTQVIARAFPRMKCIVLDLPHVVDQATAGDGNLLQFVAGDMFESIPPANAVFLKNILHEWGDHDCVKILQCCKEAIPTRNAGGKVIIVDMVRGSAHGDNKISETEVLQNMFMMYVNGVERGESEWKKIFSDAGFSNDYKIMPILGPLSVIEIYP